MVDPVDLGLVRQLQQALVERPRRSEIVAERLFDQQPPKSALILVEKAMGRQAFRDLAEKVRRRCKIESGIARSHARGERPIGGFVTEVASEIGDPPAQLLPSGVAGIDELGQLLPERFVIEILLANAEDVERIGDQALAAQIDERRHQQPAGEVAGDSEDHQGRGRRRFRPGRASSRGLDMARRNRDAWPRAVCRRTWISTRLR